MSASLASAATNASAAAQGVGESSRARIADDFDTFLTLLTTQLRNQSPADPLNPNEMTQQLVQFAQVEQQMQQNQNLERLVALQQSSQLVAAAPLVGREVQVESERLALQDGTAQIAIAGGPSARLARVSVLDQAGRAVLAREVTVPREGLAWRWDGKDATGRQLADGAYRVMVSGGAEGETARALPFTVRGRVTGAEQQEGELRLRLGALGIGMDRLRGLGGT
jgi:flagellar basal-body rod modification protein FlgD